MRGDSDDEDRVLKVFAEQMNELLPSDAPDSQPEMGIEARSISKSLETETLKLSQYISLNKTDRHYFRARFNYYKLSILRLRTFEREILEPKLEKFHMEIVQREFEIDSQDLKPTPFLEPVPKHVRIEAPAVEYAASVVQNPISTPSSLMSMKSELQLVRMALQAELSAESRKILTDALDRLINKI